MKRLGILGGMGPAASAEFLVRLIQQTPASCDQEHIPTVVWSDPTIPDRSTSLRNHDDLPWEKLKRGIQGLKNADCDHIVIPCNTAHFWYDRLAGLGVSITHIVDSVIDQLRQYKVENTRIGVMGTQATIEFGLYQQHLSSQGWDCIVPTQIEMDTLVQPAIDLIKAGKIDQAHELLITVAESLIARGAKAVVLGCTEIPLAVREDSLNGYPMINSIDSLVKSVLTKWIE